MITISQENYDMIMGYIYGYVPKLAAAIFVLIIGFILIKIIKAIVGSQFKRVKIEKSLALFLVSLIGIALHVLLLITVISMLGVQMTSFIAVLGAAGLAVGLALQGSLSNFAGGVLVLLFKPFKVGDVIEGQGHTGKVEKIDIFSTILKTPDNKTIIIPNGALSNDSIVNYSTEKTRRVDLVAGIGYEDDIGKAKDLLMKMAKSHKDVLKDKEPMVVVSELADSSVNIAFRVWTKSEDYWGVYFDLTEKIKLEFDKAGLSIPYPQRDVHLYKEK